MKQRCTIETIGKHEGTEVTLEGWLVGRRSSGKVMFLEFRDGTGFLQCVASRAEVGEETFEALGRLTVESSLRVTGAVRADQRAPGGFELSVRAADVVQVAEEYPIGRKEHGPAFLMDHRHLWIRSSGQFAVLRVRATVVRAIRNYLDSRGYVQMDSPLLTPAACEGTSTLFETKYFDESAYLSQSGQLYNEATAMAFGRVYCFGPSFRAEKSKTRRHLIEFWQVEPEVAYADLDDIMEIEEELVSEVVAEVLRTRGRELAILGRDPAQLRGVEPPFPRIAYSEAVERIRKGGLDIEWGRDLGAEHETLLSKQFDRPVLVHRYPRCIKPFYMEVDPENAELSLSVDMLAPEGYGEIVGGGQRMSDLATLEARIEEEGLPRADYEWYLDLRRYGSVPHAGFGLGVERTVAWICGLEHCREAIPFPRMLYRLRP
ncbi:MAG: asparagine--tRNA ligase [Candidatus Eisenbacteria bacterium]|nr:asparagine--tRNA ligase [Candidatus Eisenbacteria bacterium]